MLKPLLRALALLSVLAAFVAVALHPKAGSADCPPYSDEHIKVELVAEDASFAPGSEPLVGLKFTIQEHWHIYWKNPGESGLPPEVKQWTLPEGWTAGPILWPTPERSVTLGLVSYGYEGTVILPVRLKIPATQAEEKVTLRVKLEWLVCHEECVPGDADLCLEIPVAKGAPKPSADRDLFEEARRLWPQPLPAGTASVAPSADGKGVDLTLKGPGPWADPKAELYAFIEEVLEGRKRQSAVDPSAEQTVRREGDATIVRLPFTKKRTKMAAHMDGILSVTKEGKREGFVLSLDDPSSKAVGAPPGGPTATSLGETGPEEGGEERWPLWLLLLGAFVGGLVLNIMPCVLPVLSIKILGFVGQGDEDPVKVRRHGYAFALGVVASFWVLAGALLLLRAGGEKLGWGFHLQEPAFIAALMAIMLVVGLNLMGVFEMGLSVMTLAGDAATKIHATGYTASFLSGALATVIATPCTAPMMGPAVGYAVVAPVFECVLLFTVLGIGMATPYVVLTMSPRLLKKVPRPGPWMETFKHALSFPMFAVVIWLGLVFGGQTSVKGLSILLFGMLFLAIALWIYGHWGTPERSTRVRGLVGYGLSALFLLGAIGLAVKALNLKEEDNAWSPERVEKELVAGHVVFVDFTADWCVSCKANEAAFIDTDDVHEAAKKYNVVMLVADWTKKDKKGAIWQEMQKYGRSSVPLYLVISPHPGRKVIVLPVTLTSSQQIIDAFAAAAAPNPPAASPKPPEPPGK